jgi:hypothetical protein
MKSKIEYQPNALVIYLPTSDPAALHSQLMQSIASNMSCIFACTQPYRNSVDITPIIGVLQTLLPDERALGKAY